MIGSAIPPISWIWLTAVLGVSAVSGILWLNGIRAARPLVALLMVATGAAAGFLAPVLWHATLARLTTVITGIIVGLIFGGLLFRIAQAVLAAVLAASVVVGLMSFYAGVWTPRAISGLTAAPAAVTHGNASQPARKAAPPSTSRSTTAKGGRAAPTWLWIKTSQVGKGVIGILRKMPAAQRNEMYAIAAGVGLIAFLLGIVFPRGTSLVGGAWMGVLMLFTGLNILGIWYAPRAREWADAHLHPLWIFSVFGILGMAVQYRHIHREKKNKKTAAAEEKK